MKLTKKMTREIVSTVLIVGGIFAFRSSFAEAYVVPSGSMEPTIQPGDHLFVSKMAYDLKIPFTDISLTHLSDPKRGDVIVFQYPKDPSINYIKRLIGLPGDTVEVKDGYVAINGQMLEISKADQQSLAQLAKDEPGAQGYLETIGDVTHEVQRLPHAIPNEGKKFMVPEGQYFFMGDNRDNSNDSRFWGFVPKHYLKGKAFWVWLSIDTDHGTLPSLRWNRFGQKV